MSKVTKQKLAINPAAAPLPRYRVVADQIAELIRQGALEPGQRCHRMWNGGAAAGQSPHHSRGHDLSGNDGYVETRFGYGAFVAQRLPSKGLG